MSTPEATARVAAMKSSEESRQDEKLARLGRRVIEMKIRARRQRAQDREVINVVRRHIWASASELQERLTEATRKFESLEPTEAEIQAEVDKIR